MTSFSIRTTLGVSALCKSILVVKLLTFTLEILGMCGCAGGVCLQGHSLEISQLRLSESGGSGLQQDPVCTHVLCC